MKEDERGTWDRSVVEEAEEEEEEEQMGEEDEHGFWREKRIATWVSVSELNHSLREATIRVCALPLLILGHRIKRTGSVG